MDRTIDYSPLFAVPSRDEVVAFRRATLSARPTAQSEQIVRVITWVLGGLMATVLGLSVLVPAIAAIATVGSGQFDATQFVGAVPALLIIAIAAVLVVRAVRAGGSQWQNRLRMARFAEANGLHYEPVSIAPTYPGAIFGIGTSRQVTDHFRTTGERFLDFGNYRYVTGSGKNRSTHDWGFLALHLDRALPHMLLDSRANNGLLGATNLPAVFSREQVLSLEGDFNRYFTLYCPRQYERDALYVFTPDLMALLIDEAAPFDVEIVDQWMFVYSARPFALGDPATYQRLLGIVSTVGAKTLTQTDRYVDERVGEFAANLVAPQGQRLRRGVPWGTIIALVSFMVLWLGGIILSYR